MKNKTFLLFIVLFDIIASAVALFTTFIIRFRLDIIPSDIELYYSDLIIPEGGRNHVAIDVLTTVIKNRLNESGIGH